MRVASRLALLVLCGPLAAAAAPEAVTIASLDGKLQLQAHWFKTEAPGRRPAVIILHRRPAP